MKKLKLFGFKTQQYGSGPLHPTTKKMLKRQAWCNTYSSIFFKLGQLFFKDELLNGEATAGLLRKDQSMSACVFS